MMKAIHACLEGQDDPERLRVVCFMTDGYVGNDMAIIDAVAKNAGTARVFAFGIGRSVNRFLLDGIARAGRGEVHYILDEQQAKRAAEPFYERVRTPVLTDVEIDFGDLQVAEVYPQHVPDLFAAKPVVVKGQYKRGGKGTIILRGMTGEGPFERKIEVTLPDDEPENAVLAPLWARAKVAELMQRDLTGVQRGNPNPAVKEEILGLGLRFQIMTQFTSFVAVEHLRITEGGQARTVAVPVEMPEGVSYEGVFGNGRFLAQRRSVASYGGMAAKAAASAPRPVARPPALGVPMQRPADRQAAGEEATEDAARSQAQPKPAEQHLTKLTAELRKLVEKLASEGKIENLTEGKIKVKDGRLEITVQLTSLDDETIKKLEALGFKELARTRTVKLVIGTIAVDKLEALAKLDEVLRIEPVTVP